MKRFRLHQRVFVWRAGFNAEHALPGLPGTVERLRLADHAAWIALDVRQEVLDVHQFPANDETRSRHVLARPEDCSVVRVAPTESTP